MAYDWSSIDKRITKQILQRDGFTKKPTERSVCSILIDNLQVTGCFPNDLGSKVPSEIFDGVSSKTLTLGEVNTDLDRQVERAIYTMMDNERSLVTITVPHFEEGQNQDIVIKFEIILLSHKPYKSIWEWTPKEKYEIALKHKEVGVQLFKAGSYVDAFHKFSKACKILITLEPIEDLEIDETLVNDINTLRLMLYNNMAGCQLTKKNFEHTITLCNKIVAKEQNNVKALYRRGTAYGNLRDFEKAAADMKRVVELDSKNSVAREQLAGYNAVLLDAKKRFEGMVRKMFKT
ncbi:70 kDa peptidyl-prolyl isomerase [Orussus abietinus]|uniref:70 kDa peptidyl-prolyl isomerase n=1 Tax=Orussus abietinus TaxID=222816 RepID=UPI000625D817|nr:70 kDa peptidyl-prolyl isomerase [Orussus abietinus]XP_012275821.1 70 kDa peptidyl-prolyl isomerase [Orussus abietinus]